MMKDAIKYLIGGLLLGLILAANLKAQSRPFGRGQSLFADIKAHRVGDIVTIHIVEFSEGSNETNSRTAKESKNGASGTGSGALKFFPLFGFDSKSNVDFTGRGNTNRSGVLRAKMTAKIKSIDANGNYVIEGSREVGINHDKMLMKLTGVVRPEDISSDNIVVSYQIADAKISYYGKGHTDGSQKPGWITRIFGWLF